MDWRGWRRCVELHRAGLPPTRVPAPRPLARCVVPSQLMVTGYTSDFGQCQCPELWCKVQLTPLQSRSEVVFISKCDRVLSVNRVNTTLPCLPVPCKQLSSELEQAASCHDITTTRSRHHHMFRALMLLLLIQSIQVHCSLVCQREIIIAEY